MSTPSALKAAEIHLQASKQRHLDALMRWASEAQKAGAGFSLTDDDDKAKAKIIAAITKANILGKFPEGLPASRLLAELREVEPALRGGDTAALTQEVARVAADSFGVRINSELTVSEEKRRQIVDQVDEDAGRPRRYGTKPSQEDVSAAMMRQAASYVGNAVLSLNDPTVSEERRQAIVNEARKSAGHKPAYPS